MIQAGYDPEALIEVMRILTEASGGQRQPEFLSTHPNPENRVQRIREAIEKYKNKQ
jgi:predicted Zn-dependent protease